MKDPKTDTIKPCDCGGQPKRGSYPLGGKAYYVLCPKCGSQVGFFGESYRTQIKADEAWDERS